MIEKIEQKNEAERILENSYSTGMWGWKDLPPFNFQSPSKLLFFLGLNFSPQTQSMTLEIYNKLQTFN